MAKIIIGDPIVENMKLKKLCDNDVKNGHFLKPVK